MRNRVCVYIYVSRHFDFDLRDGRESPYKANARTRLYHGDQLSISLLILQCYAIFDLSVIWHVALRFIIVTHIVLMSDSIIS